MAPRAPRQTDLPEVLRGADLSGRDLTGVDLSGRDLGGADLREAILFEANLAGAVLVGADLGGADLRECRAARAIFGHANLDGALLLAADLSGASFISASLVDADLRGADLGGATFRDADLEGACLDTACARGASFVRANLCDSSLEDCELAGARFSHARGYDRASWIDADLVGMDLRGAHQLYRFALDQNYLYEFRERSRANAAIYAVWKLTSDCGRSLGRWMLFVGGVAALFALAYTQVAVDYGDHETAISPLYFSAVTLTTLGYGDALPASTAAQLIAEVVFGYISLGGLVCILANKLARRAG